MSVIANNRFLQRTNPTMLAAIDDGGSVLDRVYIQNAARQIVDQGHWDNLKFWGLNGLAKLRTSGGDDYVPKLYDLSGEENDGVQTTNDNQPKWTSEGMDFDGSNDFLDCGNDSSITDVREDFTINFWANIKQNTKNEYLLGRWQTADSKRTMGITYRGADSVKKLNLFISGDGSVSPALRTETGNVPTNQWIMWTFIAQSTGRIFQDGSELTGSDIFQSIFWSDNLPILNSDVALAIGAGRVDGANPFTGGLNDIRIYDTALTATEIAAIYDQTKYLYE